ncbi:MAG: cell division protein FtsZ, partial [Candidatus Sulfotelmatobacter sp.]
RRAIASPLLEAGAIDGARGILINITGSASLKLAEVQQACTIIQSAAHEDANIIFGAVMDEKMKDTVKITVIATGFREVNRAHHRPAGAHHSFAATHDDAMGFSNTDFPDPVGPAPATSFPEPFREMTSERIDEARMTEPSPIAMAQVAMAHAGGEVISLDGMRSAMVANFEQDDLDVPAFLRKRGEVM